MKNKKLILIGIIVVLLIIILTLIVYINTYKKVTRKIDEQTNISVYSCLDLMPTWPENEDNNEAYFIITISGTKQEDFFDKYEISNIDINGKEINLDEINYEKNYTRDMFNIRVYTDNYETNNNVLIKLKDKKKHKYKNIRLYSELKTAM